MLARLLSSLGLLRRSSHETTTFSAPRASSDEALRASGESVTTSLGDSSVTSYRGTVRLFLTYLGAQYSEVHSLKQLRRDPHILGWLALLRSHHPPLATITRANHAIYLRRLLEELAWTQHIPDLAHLLGPDDVPRKEHHLPRPLTPEQDELVQQELLRRDDLLSNALLLLRLTGMRISECVDLSFDCLRLVGPRAVGHPRAARKTQNGTLGSRGFRGLSTGRTHPFAAATHRTQVRSSPIASAARSLPNDSQTTCRLARRHRRPWYSRPHHPAPISTHIWN